MTLSISSGGGRMVWTMVAPSGTTQFTVPDLGSVASDLGLVHGAITTTVSFATIEGFSYGNLRYGDLDSSAWNAYGVNTATGTY